MQGTHWRIISPVSSVLTLFPSYINPYVLNSKCFLCVSSQESECVAEAEALSATGSRPREWGEHLIEPHTAQVLLVIGSRPRERGEHLLLNCIMDKEVMMSFQAHI